MRRGLASLAVLSMLVSSCAGDRASARGFGQICVGAGVAMAASGGAGILWVDESESQAQAGIDALHAQLQRLSAVPLEPPPRADYSETPFVGLAIAGAAVAGIGLAMLLFSAEPRATDEPASTWTSTVTDERGRRVDPRGSVWR